MQWMLLFSRLRTLEAGRLPPYKPKRGPQSTELNKLLPERAARAGGLSGPHSAVQQSVAYPMCR